MIVTHNIGGIETTIESDSIDLDAINTPNLVGIDVDIPVIDKAILRHYEGDTVNCGMSAGSLEFTAPARDYDKSETIFYLAELAAEQKRQLNGGLLVHAAGVYLPEQDRGVLIMGEKGSGKTSTAVGLCLEANADLVGNDQIILGSSEGKINLIEGSKDILLRRTAAIHDERLMSLVEFTDDSKPNWDNKVIVRPDEVGIKTTNSPHNVTDILQVVIDRTVEKTTIKRCVMDLQTLLFLTEKLSRHIRGVTTPIIDNDGAFEAFSPSLDNDETSRNRKNIIKMMLNCIGLTKVYASSTDEVIEFIITNHD